MHYRAELNSLLLTVIYSRQISKQSHLTRHRYQDMTRDDAYKITSRPDENETLILRSRSDAQTMTNPIHVFVTRPIILKFYDIILTELS